LGGLYYIQTPLTGMLLIAIIFYNSMQLRGRWQNDQKLFFALLSTNFLLLLFELLIDMLSGKVLPGGTLLLKAVALVFYTLNPVPGALYILFLYSLVNHGKRPHPLVEILLWLPVALNTILSVASLFMEMTFQVDAFNIYHRGQNFLYMPILSFTYLIIGPVVVYRKRKKILRKEFSSLLLFPFPVLIGAVVQTCVYGMELLWVSLSISLLIVYLNIQTTQASKDYLTGLFNRRRFDLYLSFLISEHRTKAKIGGIMMDIDSFKKINDTYGHELGDQALRAVADILLDSLPKRYHIARYGGDEFIVLMEIETDDAITRAVESIGTHLEVFNQKGILPFPLHLSYGWGVYENQDNGDGAKNFIKFLDDRMYAAKPDSHSACACKGGLQ